ncbi:choline/ethanolamine kinase family protein [Subtercola endophyticus]|uniref:choline/ethanolamine kinase family protein n=1 Tax=Subtercola endophyticus TaxID=2895559 RepID=UPI001E3C99CA|nr:choline/ethanolamine kinase family protein [Subtercola endophyticus]UFS58615.1 phosphotransferase family protein [Subtercola endophyticus]
MITERADRAAQKSTEWHRLDSPELAQLLPGLPEWPWAGRLALSPIGGGLNNLNWRLQVEDGSEYFLKVPGAGTELFVDRRLANEAAVSASTAGIAPPVAYFDLGSGIEVTGFLAGYRSLTEIEVSTTDFIFEVVATLKKLHARPLLSGTHTAFDVIRESLDGVRSASIVLPRWAEDVIGAWFDAEAAITAAGFDLAPCHNDPNFPNFMHSPGRSLQLVDYEYSANNDPTYELGGVLGFYGLHDRTRRALLEEYYGVYTAAAEARMWLMTVGLLTRFGLWAAMYAHTRDADYDYQKYGLVYFSYAAAIVRDPRWPSWLAQV